MKQVLVTGSYGQLGNEIKKLSSNYPSFNFLFTDVDSLDICSKNDVAEYCKKNNINVIINCAAYTAVDKAEDLDQQSLCQAINADAVKNLAETANNIGAQIIHISTDYVFDGTNHFPYSENNPTNPQSIYGKTKLLGEKYLLETCKNSIIIRTSWLYSTFGNNFVKTMLKLGAERENINVIFDQIGTPTYAKDLAYTILEIADKTSKKDIDFVPGIFHFSNEGVCSWYDFTIAIHQLANITNCKVSPIETKDYPTKAKRPHYSVLNKHKIKQTYQISIPHWQESLKECIKTLLQNN